MKVSKLALFLLIIKGMSAQTQLEPKNVVVLRGSEARFNCSTTQNRLLAFTVKGNYVINIQQSSVNASNPRFSARNLETTPGNYKWEFIISNVERGDAGEVACLVLGAESQSSVLTVQERGTVKIVGGNRTVTEGVQTGFQCQAVGWYPEPNVSWSINGVVQNYCNSSVVSQGNVFNTNCTLTVTAAQNSSIQCLAKVPVMSTPDSSTVLLTVVPKPSTRDQTILIAVTVAFSAAALLFLLIVLIVICCKRRKEKRSYQEQVRRARTHSHHRAPKDARGRDNRGYARDGRYGGDTNGAVWHTNYSNRQQQMSYPPYEFLEKGPRNHRHMTTV